MPTIEEVCSTFGLNDVEIDYSDQDMQNLTSYKLFQQHVRPFLTKENPKVRRRLSTVNGTIGSDVVNYLFIGANVKADDVSGSQMARFLQY